MMNKELYQIWAPDAVDKWTRFAKPVLFDHADNVDEFSFTAKIANIPRKIIQLHNKKTAIIIDLPSETGVEVGLGLASEGFRPVPLYNGMNEAKNAELEDVVKNQPIIDALVASAGVLKHLKINFDAPPVFLLDYNRDEAIDDHVEANDNSWRVDFEDLPEPSYLIANKIDRLILWSKDKVKQDIIAIIDTYRDAGVEILIFTEGSIIYQGNAISELTRSEIIETKELVRQFENSRFIMIPLMVLAFINSCWQLFINEVPLLRTAPSVQWLSHFWVSERIDQMVAMTVPIAMMIPGLYLILYLGSRKKRHLLVVASIAFAIDAIGFYFYALFFYGTGAFIRGNLVYGLIVFLPPIFFMIFLARGGIAWKKLKGVNEIVYLSYLNLLDKTNGTPLGISDGRGRRRRGYRGRRGYR